MGFLSGKRALIVGVASDRSIAWGIAQAMHREGAELAFTYVNEKFKERVQPLAESLGSKIVVPLDVTNDAEIETAFAAVKQAWGHLDIVVAPEEPGRCRSLTVNPSLARLSVTSTSSWWMTQSPSPRPRSEVLPAAGTRPAR